MTKSIFFCALKGIKVNEDLGQGICIVPNKKDEGFPKFYITNNQKVKERLFNQNTVTLIGLIEYNDILNSSLIAYSADEFSEDSYSSLDFLNLHLKMLKVYFFCTWLVKDNSANFDLGFLSFENKKKEFEISSNYFYYHNFNSQGDILITEFSKNELLKAAAILKENTIVGIKVNITASGKKYGKISTSRHFVQFARACSDLGLKMTNYCSALETLFSNDNTELSHRLSERVSHFLGGNKSERVELYKTLKSSYNVRSKVVHGGLFKDGQLEDLTDLIVKMDDICRKVMTYCYSTSENENIFNFKNEKLEEYFINKILE